MATRKTNHIAEVPTKFCDDCIIGEWFTVHWNLDCQGKPITKHCKYGGKGILRGTPACSHYKDK